MQWIKLCLLLAIQKLQFVIGLERNSLYNSNTLVKKLIYLYKFLMDRKFSTDVKRLFYMMCLHNIEETLIESNITHCTQEIL